MSLLASADAGVVLADQYGLTLPEEAGRASADAPRALIDSLSAQANRPMAHTTAADPNPAQADPQATNQGSNR